MAGDVKINGFVGKCFIGKVPERERRSKYCSSSRNKMFFKVVPT